MASKRFRVLGVEHRAGTYEGKAYDNYNLHVSQPMKDDGAEGERVCTFKLRSADFDEITEDTTLPIKCPADLFGLVGLEIKIYADKYFIVEELRE